VAKNGQKISQKGRFSLFSKNIKKKTRKNISRPGFLKKKGETALLTIFLTIFGHFFGQKSIKL
jgi:hypothetical protein